MDLARRAFTLTDQLAFAQLSGDQNPIHVDPVAARRLLNGHLVVHGLHLAAWGIESLVAEHPCGLERLQASFHRPLAIEEGATSAAVRNGDGWEIRLSGAGQRLARVHISVGPAPGALAHGLPAGAPDTLCQEMEFEQAIAAGGEIELFLDSRLADQLLPRTRRALGDQALAEFLACTRLIGMVCPGRHSVFAELSLSRRTKPGPASSLRWRVERADPRFRRLVFRVEGGALEGSLVAFLRAAPVAQPSCVQLEHTVRPDEFAGRRALVVGGSRGLGEIAAKLLALGGSDVALTYATGAGDAALVVAQITAAGRRARAVPFDVLSRGVLDVAPGHLYYFASPPIVPTGLRRFAPKAFAHFCSFYVSGFAATYEALREGGAPIEMVVQPSSTYVEEAPPGLLEYATAKAAAEALAAQLGRRDGIIFRCPRLPPVRTDQTAALHQPLADPIPLLLQLLGSANKGDVK